MSQNPHKLVAADTIQQQVARVIDQATEEKRAALEKFDAKTMLGNLRNILFFLYQQWICQWTG